jgi:hypothetical protein
MGQKIPEIENQYGSLMLAGVTIIEGKHLALFVQIRSDVFV